MPGLRWQYQLQGAANVDVCATPASASVQGNSPCVRPDVYVIDLYAADGSTPNTTAVKQIHARHAQAVCYVDAGSWEDWRPDAAKFPKRLLGKGNGWPGERWLDIRATGVLLPIMDARVQKCAKAGFDAVDFDDVEGYANKTGFPLTGARPAEVQPGARPARPQAGHGGRAQERPEPADGVAARRSTSRSTSSASSTRSAARTTGG